MNNIEKEKKRISQEDIFKMLNTCWLELIRKLGVKIFLKQFFCRGN